MNTKIVVADDMHMVRKAFVMALQLRADFEVCAQVADGIEALRAIDFYHPHILLLDLHMPGLDGIEVLKELQRRKSPVKTIVVSQFDKPETIAQCMDLGARCFLSSFSMEDEEQEAIDLVMDTGFYINNQTAQALLKNNDRLKRFDPHLSVPAVHFNDIQMRVLNAFARQLTGEEIASEVCLSPKSIERIKSEMADMLKAKNFMGVFIYALQNGVINLDDIPIRLRHTG